MSDDVFVIDDVRVFDGRDVIERATVTIAGASIHDVGEPHRLESDVPVIDGRGRTLIPGLIDSHVHCQSGSLQQALTFGVTTEIDLFNDPVAVTAFRQEAATRDDVADFRSAGTGATTPGGHPGMAVDQGLVPPFPTVAGPDEASSFVADRLAEGSDLLKIFVEPGVSTGATLPSLDAATVAALTAAARRHRMTSLAHCTDAASARLAIENGADGLAHVPCDRRDAGLIELARARDVLVIPTLVMFETLCGRSAADRLVADPCIAPHLDSASRQTLSARWPLGDVGERHYPVAARVVGDLHSAGVAIVAGSDAGNPGTAHGASLHRELELLVDAGLTPCEALAAATATPARLLGLDDRGEVRAGRRADLVLVDGDPTTDISTTRRICAVWRNGTSSTARR